jgi:glycosyltransferase 2 family protein
VTKRFLLYVLQYALGIGVLAGGIWLNRASLREALSNPLQPGPLVMALGALMVGLFLTFLRWFILVRAQSLPFKFTDAIRLGMSGFFFNNILPGSIGGDIVKAAFIARQQSRRAVAVATVLVDRVVGLWGLVWVIALMGGIFWVAGNQSIINVPRLQLAIEVAGSIVVLSLLGWLLFGLISDQRAERFAARLGRVPKLGHTLAEFWHAGRMYHRQRLSVFGALLLALAGHACFATAFFNAANTFSNPAHPAPIPALAEHFVFFPIGELFQSFFPAPGGAGGAEASFAVLYQAVGSTYETGFNAGIAFRCMYLCWGLVGFVVYMTMRPTLQPAAKEPDERLALVEV